MMLDVIANRLTTIVEDSATRLRELDEASASLKKAPSSWSIKEIVGHLVDSAANNHHRFVRAPVTAEFVFPNYDQDGWMAAQNYQESSWEDLVELWRLYNLHLAQVIRRVPKDRLRVECRIGPNEPETLEYLIEDYLVHLQHHLKQVEERRATIES